MFNTTITIGLLLHIFLLLGFYSRFKRTAFIQSIVVFHQVLLLANFKLERIKNLISYIGTHIISLRIKFTSSNEIFNKNYSYRECNRRQLLNRSNDDVKMASYQIEAMTMFGFNFGEFKAVLSFYAAKRVSIKHLKVSF